MCSRYAAADSAVRDDCFSPTVAEIHLGNLLGNLDVFRSRGSEVMAVVKADAYGHGAVRIAHELSSAGVKWFAVATVGEGIQLRRSGLTARILILAAPLPEFLPAYVVHDLDVTVSSIQVAKAVVDAAGESAHLRAHVKVDTGMSRLGIRPDEADDVVAMLERAPGVEIAGIWTHFATSDEPDLDFAYRQMDSFNRVVSRVGDAASHIHAANSAAALRMPESYDFDRSLIRIGIGLFGYAGLAGLAESAGLQPVMRVASRVTHTAWMEPGTTVSYGRRWAAKTRTRIATIGAGYADGYPRLLTNRGEVAIDGRRYPVAGTICMDMFMVDVGANEEVAPGDEVVLFGPGNGTPSREPNASDVAGWAETIPYEILTGIAPRVPRVYTE